MTLVITELDVGGAEKALVSLATGLDRSRWTPSVVALGPEAELARPLREAGIETTFLDVSRRRPWRAVTGLAKVFRETRPPLVQSFLFHANIASRIAGRLAGVKVVLGGLRVAEKGAGWHLLVDRWTSRLSSGSVCVSEGVFRHAKENGLLGFGLSLAIPNGIDPATLDSAPPLDRASVGIEDVAHLALFVGRIDRQKGVDFLLEAAGNVASSVPDWRLVLVGDGPLRAELESKTAADPILASSVRWLGRRGDVPSLMKAADVLVLPSLWEGMPNVVLEAMAARLAVVATRVEGSEELVRSGSTGWLVPAGDSKALARALIDATTDPGRLKDFGAEGRRVIEAKYTRAAVIGAYDRFWSTMLGMEQP